MNDYSVLDRIGLSKHEKEIYLSLLESGPSTISQLAKDTGLHRPTIYQTLPLLKERGLVAVSPRGRKGLFVAESPEKLERMVTGIADEFMKSLPELMRTYSSRDAKPIVKFYEGKKGIGEVLEDQLRWGSKGDVYYRYGSRKESVKIERYLSPGYHERRDKKKIEHFVITSEKIGRLKKKKLERVFKVIPTKEDPFDYNISQLIYGDKVAFIDYNTETALVIQNKLFAEYQKKLFRFLYDRL